MSNLIVVDVLCPQDGLTALHYVAAGCDVKVVQLLLEKGADVNAVTKAQSDFDILLRF